MVMLPGKYYTACILLSKHTCWDIYYWYIQHCFALRYKPEGRVFDSRWGRWDISLTAALWPSGRQPPTEISGWAVKAEDAFGWQHDDIHVWLSWNLGASNSRSRKALSRSAWDSFYNMLRSQGGSWGITIKINRGNPDRDYCVAIIQLILFVYFCGDIWWRPHVAEICCV